MNRAQARVLHRNEAQQMVADLGTAINNVISLAAEASDVDKVLAADTLVLLRTKQATLESEIAWTDREAAERDLAVLKRGAAARRCTMTQRQVPATKAGVSFRGVISNSARKSADPTRVNVDAMNDLANRLLEMLRLLQLPFPEVELHEIVRYSLRRAPGHYFDEPCALMWFQLALVDVQYWDFLRDCGDVRGLRLVGEVEARQ